MASYKIKVLVLNIASFVGNVSGCFSLCFGKFYVADMALTSTTILSHILIMMLCMRLNFITALTQRLESIPANHKPQYKLDSRLQTSNSVLSGRIFVPATSNSVNSISSATSPSLILESQEFPPAPVTRFAVPPVLPPVLPPIPAATSLEKLASIVHSNPILAALLISSLLSVRSPPKQVSYNSPEHLPTDPYVALTLSHYGRYIPKIKLYGHGIYAYTASNNLHNNQPIGSYKIIDDSNS